MGVVAFAWAQSALAAPPPNDQLPDAVSLTGTSGAVAGTTVEATQEGYEAAHHWPFGDGGSVWYRWVAPTSDRYVFDTLDAATDTVVALYHPGGTHGLTRVASDDDAWWRESGSRVRIDAIAGATYYLAVAGKYESTPGGAFTLRWRVPVSPPNDLWVWAQELTGAGGTVAGTTAGATPPMPEEREAKHGLHGGHSAWYVYRAAAAGTVTATVTSAYRTIVTAYEGTTPGTDVVPAASDVDPTATTTSRVRFEVEPGKQYRIGVDGWNGATGPFDLTWAFEAASLDPPHDDFANAQPLATASGTLTATSFGATAEQCEPRKPLEGRRSVWYRLDAPFTGTLTVDTAGSRFDTVLTVMDRQGTCYSSSGWSDDDGGGDELASRLAVSAIDGFTYWIAVGGHSTDTGAFTLNWRLTPVAPPANDAFAAATTISGQAGTLSLRNSGASKEAGEPAHAGEAGGRSVWFRWTAPQTGRAMFRVREPSYTRVNPVLAVYRGASVDALTPIASSRDWASRTARVVFDVVAGQSYALAVDTVAGNEGPASPHMTLKWNTGTPPPNDLFADATAVSGDGGSVPGTNRGAIDEAGEPAHSDLWPAAASVWYRWVAPSSGQAVFGVTAPDGITPLFAAYAGTTLGGLTRIDRSSGQPFAPPSAIFEIVEGRTYYFAVDGIEEQAFDFSLWWRATPVNDDFEDAVVLTGASGSAEKLNEYGTAEPGEPRHAGRLGGMSVWYRWTAPQSGTVVFETCRSGFHTTLAAYTGTRVDALTQVAAAGGSWCGDRSRIWFDVAAGQEYRIAVDSFYSGSVYTVLDWRYDSSGASGGFDAWASPASLPREGGGPTLHANVGATKESGEPNHAGNAGGRSVWFEVQALAQGQYTIDLAGSGFDTLVAVYRVGQYDTISTQQLVAANDDADGASTSRVTWTTAPNTVYRVAVDGKDGASGTFSLDATWHAVPGNDGFAYAMDGFRADSTLATREAGEPVHGTATGRSVWFRYHAYDSGPVTVDTHGSDFDTSLAVYTGSTLSTLVRVAQNDDWSGVRTSRATFEAVAGTTYRIAVDGSGGAVAVNVGRGTSAAGPAHDHFELPAEIAGASGTVSPDTTGATRAPGEPQHHEELGAGTVWFRWTAPAGGTAIFHTLRDGGSPRLALYTGADMRGLTRVVSATGDEFASHVRVEARVAAGTTYRVALAGGRTLSWLLRPDGDAAPLVDVALPTEGARLERWTNFSAEASDADGIARVDVYVRDRLLRSDSDRPFAFTWDPQQFADGPADLVVRAYDAAGAVTEVVRAIEIDTRGPWATITDGPPEETDSASATFAFTVDETGATTECRLDYGTFAPCTSPVTYEGLAAGRHTFGVRARSSTGRLGDENRRDWTIATPPAVRPANDDLAQATVLNGESGGVDATNVDATKEPSEPAHATRPGGKSIWFSWTAPRTGRVFFDTVSTAFADPLLAVYTGDSVASLALVHQNDDWDVGTLGYQARLHLGAVAGTTYRIAVDGEDRTAGPVRLNWRYLPEPPPVDTIPPQTDFLSVPPSSSTSGSATFSFTSYQVGSTFECRLDDGAWSACRSPHTLSGLIAGAHAFEVRATDVAGNTDPTPARHQWTVAGDTTAPETTITGGPSGTVTSTSASFTFTTDDPYAGFECSLDGGQWIGCASPHAYSSLAYGTHEFRVRARDTSGNVDATPATRTWTIAAPDTSAPDTTITSGPSGTTTSTSASFSFTATEAGAVFECALDGAAFAACTSPRSYSGLSGGSHSFVVRARDAAGNVDASPATRSWTIFNDAFAAARPLAGASGGVTGSNAGATKESGEPNHAGDRGGASVWFTWTAPASGSVSMDTRGSSFDTLLAVYTGGSVSALTTIAANNNADGLTTSRLSFTATAGVVYRIAVDGRRGRTGTYWLNWSQAASPPPPGDTTAPDTTITAGPSGTVTATDASFSFTSNESGSTFACRLDGAAFAACTSPRTYTGLAAGTHVFEVRATDASGNVDASPASRTWTISASSTTSNDMFANAFALTGGAGTTTGSTVGMTIESGEPYHAGNVGGKSIWFTWTAPKSATVTIDTIGSNYDTLLAAYTGTAVNALTTRASNDDASGLQSRISFSATAGVVYRIAVDGYNGASGSVTLNWSQP